MMAFSCVCHTVLTSIVMKIFAFLLFFTFASFLHAQTRTEDMIFKVAVFGPADELYIWWGHAALIVKNTRWGFSRVFDWGIFSYPSDNFMLDFVKNRVQYRVATGILNLNEYIEEDRDIVIFTLDLDTKSKEIMLSYAENRVLLENRYYDYHQFRDNCATGIRDILDLGVGGQLKAMFGNTPGRFTLRQHVRRFTSLKPIPDWFFDFLMGRNLDRPMSVWDEMFLPAEIARNIVDFRYIDNSGKERALVKSVEIIHSSKNRQPILNKPLTVWHFHLALGLFLAFFLSKIKKLHEKHLIPARITFGISQSLLGLFFGAAGCVLFFGLFILPKDYIHQNINIFFVNPLLLAAIPLGIIAAAGKVRSLKAGKYLRLLWAYVFITGSIAAFVRLIPALNQQNQSALALILPIAWVLAGFQKESFTSLKRKFFAKK